MKTAKAIVNWLFAPLIAFCAVIGRLYEEHKLARRITLHWSQLLVTYCVYKFWQNPQLLNDAALIYLGGITALFTASIGLYQWDAARETK